MTRQDLIDAIIPVALIVSVIFNIAFVQRVATADSQIYSLSSDNLQLDAEAKKLNQHNGDLNKKISELESQIPQ